MNQNDYSNADGLSSSIANITDSRLKLGEFFYLRKTNRYSLVCVHCYQDFEDFAKFSSHIEQHLLKWGIQSVKMETEQSASTNTTTTTTTLHHSVGYHDGMPTIFKNEFGQQLNPSEMPQYFYNGYNNNPPNWFNTNSDGQQQQQMNSNNNNNNQSQAQKLTPSSSSTQFDDEFNALKRQFNEPMFIINDTPEVRQLSQYLAENYPIEKHNSQYKCPCCDKLFNGSALARRHVYTHSVEKVFSCAGCSRKFSHARHLRDHIKSKHGNPANLPDRSQSSSTTNRITNRSTSTYNINSQIGNHFLNSSSNHTSQSMALTRNAGNAAFQSEFDALCALYSDNKSIIVNDLAEIREISQYLMPTYEFAKINDQVMCPLCDGLFNSKSTVRRHLTNHLKVKMFRCAVCDREFRHARHLGEHIKQKHHGNFHMENFKQKSDQIKLNANTIKSEPYDTDYNTKIECYICHTKFKRRHKSLNESSANNNCDGPSLPYCNNCHKEMAKRSIKQNVRGSATDVVVHSKEDGHTMKNGSMKLFCKYCHISFLDQKSLIMHEMQHTKPAKNEISNNQIMPMHIQ